MNQDGAYCNAAGQYFLFPPKRTQPPDGWADEPEDDGAWEHPLTNGIPYIGKEEAIRRLEQLLSQAKELPDDVLVVGPLATMEGIEVFDW